MLNWKILNIVWRSLNQADEFWWIFGRVGCISKSSLDLGFHLTFCFRQGESNKNLRQVVQLQEHPVAYQLLASRLANKTYQSGNTARICVLLFWYDWQRIFLSWRSPISKTASLLLEGRQTWHAFLLLREALNMKITMGHTDRVQRLTQRKNCPSATLSTNNPIRTDPGSRYNTVGSRQPTAWHLAWPDPF